jgi:hypothetical protein
MNNTRARREVIAPTRSVEFTGVPPGPLGDGCRGRRQDSMKRIVMGMLILVAAMAIASAMRLRHMA